MLVLESILEKLRYFFCKMLTGHVAYITKECKQVDPHTRHYTKRCRYCEKNMGVSIYKTLRGEKKEIQES